MVDRLRIQRNSAIGCLAEHDVQYGCRNHLAADHLTQHIPWADGRQLIGISHQHQLCPWF